MIIEELMEVRSQERQREAADLSRERDALGQPSAGRDPRSRRAPSAWRAWGSPVAAFFARVFPTTAVP